MNPEGHSFPPLLDPADLPTRVLVLVAHPDDEVIGIGGLLAFHAERGDEVKVVHATRGSAGDPEGRFGDLAMVRQTEVTAALAELGIGTPSNLGFEDGALAEQEAELVEACVEIFREPWFSRDGRKLLYTFHGGEYHSDHLCVARAACKARGALPGETSVHLFGVNQAVPFGSLYDYTRLAKTKKAALACFESQLAYLDFATKVMHRDRAATVNVELEEVTHAELILAIPLGDWPLHLEQCEAWLGKRR